MKLTRAGVLSNLAVRGRALPCLGLFLLLQGTVFFPAVHHHIHPDSGEADHECAVTLFAHGQVDCSDTTVAVIRAEPVGIFALAWHEPEYVSIDVRRLPGRDPPFPLAFLG